MKEENCAYDKAVFLFFYFFLFSHRQLVTFKLPCFKSSHSFHYIFFLLSPGSRFFPQSNLITFYKFPFLRNAFSFVSYFLLHLVRWMQITRVKHKDIYEANYEGYVIIGEGIFEATINWRRGHILIAGQLRRIEPGKLFQDASQGGTN